MAHVAVAMDRADLGARRAKTPLLHLRDVLERQVRREIGPTTAVAKLRGTQLRSLAPAQGES